ncbi:TetR/AcrR family transcriptional regulator [Amycolatopsis acidicola]|uniref:TetR/AcrR family transcriptional regulator n=1 Tax=Amycolatopsis acidicola TaxID=2596893 RepID=A0A5N0UUN1_9PSEU|nr:TetR family transcriptional regulator [Amycolatopsis acidicola]KAA9154056.1 TetR/AcrR family transcriptional regulator [Amycolatopsis acidicola]
MPELPTTARGAATSRRILDAAAEEFAERGIAGARVDRIIAAAHTNKAQLYGYFGSKDGLFDAVVADRAGRLLDAVSFDAEDFPGWAVAMYDETLRNPELVRLTSWLRLERRPVARLTDNPDDTRKLAAIERAQAAGKVREGDPFDLFVLVMGMAFAWSPASVVHAASADESAADHERRRALLRDCVARVVAP